MCQTVDSGLQVQQVDSVGVCVPVCSDELTNACVKLLVGLWVFLACLVSTLNLLEGLSQPHGVVCVVAGTLLFTERLQAFSWASHAQHLVPHVLHHSARVHSYVCLCHAGLDS
jgi:hypothetical protein